MRTRIMAITALLFLAACGDNATTGDQTDVNPQPDGWEESDGTEDSGDEPENCKPNGYTLAKNDLCYRCNPEGDGIVGAGEAVDDGNPCTDDRCDFDLGVVHTENTAACDDGDSGTWGDICAAGVCQGNDPVCNPGSFYLDGSDCYLCAPDGSGPASQPQPLDDGNPCTDDSCTPEGGLKHLPNNSPCDDGDPSTYDDVCNNAACAGTSLACPPGEYFKHEGECLLCNAEGSGGEGPEISDGNICTDDICDSANGLSHVNNSGDCNDGDPTTIEDVCLDGECVGIPLVCAPGDWFEDGGLCWECADSGLEVEGDGDPIDDDDPCTDDFCDVDDGVDHLDNSAPCDDGDPETVNDTCSQGDCVGVDTTCKEDEYFLEEGNCKLCDGDGIGPVDDGVPVEDGNVCTDDSCDADDGPLHTPNAQDCDDGNPDTVNDVCAQSICSGTVVACVPGDYLLQNSLCAQCNPDGTGTVDPGQPLDNGNPCTDGSCHAEDGVVQTANQDSCDDGNPDTAADVCSGGTCIGQPVICDADEYYAEAGTCFLCNALGTGSDGIGATIDDNNLCTDDECDPDDGVVNDPNHDDCDDGDPGTTDDQCDNGVCAGDEILCPKGDYYLDQDLCYLCNGDGTGAVGPGEVVPDDGNECTADVCDAGNGVAHQELWGILCDDGDAGTGMDECKAGICVGEPVICVPGTWASSDDYACYLCVEEGTDFDDNGVKIDDDNECTDDICDGNQGLVHTFNDGPCSDGNSDTVNDTCNGQGVCIGGNQVCPPGNYYMDAALCYLCDGDGAGPMGPGAPIPDDGNECTADVCDAGNGVDHQELWGTPCSDGDAGTAMDECEDGVCVGEPIICTPGTWLSNDDWACYLCIDEGTDLDDEGVEIDDDNDCTEDACDAIDGVVHTVLEGDCWDSSDCTSDDICVAGECVGTPVDCNDYSPCTSDSCNPDGGCAHVNLDVPCDDGIALTLDDTCIDGICIGMLDPDGDGIPNYGPGGPCDGPGNLDNCVDNCPYRANAGQVDSDNDGQGNACEIPRWWTRVDTTEKVVALTFDDGWSEDALKGLLKALGEKGARASFFIAGVNLENGVLTAEVIQQGINAGHLFGNHTYSHTVGANLGETVAEINLASTTFENLVGDDLRPIYRHPYAELVPWINTALVQTGFLESVLGNFDSEDWTDPEPDAQLLADCIVAMTEPGDIIGFHVGPDATVAALPAIIDGLHAKGFTLLNIEQMMAYGPPIIVDISEIKSCSSYWDNL